MFPSTLKSFVLLMTFSLVLATACSHGRQNSLNARKTWNEVQRFNPEYKYTVRLKGKSIGIKAKGTELKKDADFLVIHKPKEVRRIPIQEIKKITGTGGEKQGSYIGKGAMYGAIGGAAIGLIPMIGLLASDSSTCGDVGDCEALKPLGVLFLPAFAGIGALLGTGIGAAIPKRSKITIIPTFNPQKGNTSAGLGISLPIP